MSNRKSGVEPISRAFFDVLFDFNQGSDFLKNSELSKNSTAVCKILTGKVENQIESADGSYFGIFQILRSKF